MKHRVLVWFAIFISFVCIAYASTIDVYLHVGTWVAGSTSSKWWLYIVVVLALYLATSFKPQYHKISAIVSAPLVVTLACKSLAVLGLLLHVDVLAFYVLQSFVGLCLAGLFFIQYYLVYRNAHEVCFLVLLLIVGLLPVAYEFTEQMLPKP